MNQPDLGLKVAELRQQKGLTQEQLAEKCEVSTRTIQRIEAGEVDPRAFTLQCLAAVLEFDFGQQTNASEGLWLVVLHLSSMFVIVLIPLLLWTWKRRQSSAVDQQGRQVLNFQITMTLLLFGAVLFTVLVSPVLILLEAAGGDANVLVMVLVGVLSVGPLIALGLFAFYQAVANTIRALSERTTHYPLSIPFVR